MRWCLFFFFKQKTAYEMRISDWSSDVCSSDLLVTDLDRDLGASTGPWLFGVRFTLADLFWAVSLYRFLWLGYSGFWKDGAGKPRVEAYANRLFARPSVKDAIIQWPGHPPSENVVHLLSNA